MGEVALLPRKPYRSSYDGIDGDGETILQTPWPLSRDELGDLEDWIAVCMRTIRRASERSWVVQIHPLAAADYVGQDIEMSLTQKGPK